MSFLERLFGKKNEKKVEAHTEISFNLEEATAFLKKKYDENFRIVFEAIKQLLEADESPRKEIGFTVKEKQKSYSKSKIRSLDGLDLTPKARAIWEAIPGNIRIKLLNNVWCVNCKKTAGIRVLNRKFLLEKLVVLRILSP